MTYRFPNTIMMYLIKLLKYYDFFFKKEGKYLVVDNLIQKVW